MSRPFSYNDDNFTIIGNVLFIHVNISKLEIDDPIVEIPYEIGRRIIQKSVSGFKQSLRYGNKGFTFSGIIKYENGKYYIHTKEKITTEYTLTAFLFLKDI